MVKVILGTWLFLEALAVARPIPRFSGPTLDGKMFVLQDALKPKRALLISFWATWCGPCLQELVHVNQELKNRPTIPIDFVTVNVDDSNSLADVRPLVRRMGFQFPIIVDTQHDLLRKFNPSKILPYSVAVDPSGNELATFTGFDDGILGKIQAKLEQTQ